MIQLFSMQQFVSTVVEVVVVVVVLVSYMVLEKTKKPLQLEKTYKLKAGPISSTLVQLMSTHPLPRLTLTSSKITTLSIGIDVYSFRSTWNATVPVARKLK